MSGLKNKSNGKVFSWNISNINNFIRETDNDKAVQISLKEIKKQKRLLGRTPKVLEAGCGNGRVIVWLKMHGIENICGIEANDKIVKEFKNRFPEFDVRCGDIMNLPKDFKNHDVVLSYGVIEHFPNGMSKPLKQMYNDLSESGVAIVTVPLLSTFRKIKYLIYEHRKWDKTKYPYCPEFYENGDFYLYWLTKKQFKNELKKAGFKIIKHTYTAPECGVLEALNHKNIPGHFIWRDDKRHFHFTFIGKILYCIMKYVPMCFSHMQLCVCKKK